jgi:hypothetical protein
MPPDEQAEEPAWGVRSTSSPSRPARDVKAGRPFLHALYRLLERDTVDYFLWIETA